ncbi:hypothetical protein M436DRAFT_80369 [Aureobasidium namibiae CBS 147.97]|uniref:Secreted protein n=1 Tax=Aureobasidium namibiae CBS 147.97 TaxID=1043004 RepID=A0A074WYQ8_9PEZI
MSTIKSLLLSLLHCFRSESADNDDNQAGPRPLVIGSPTDFCHGGTHEGGPLRASITPPPFRRALTGKGQSATEDQEWQEKRA